MRVCVHTELGGTCESTNTSIYTPVPSNDREDQLLQLWTEFNSISDSTRIDVKKTANNHWWSVTLSMFHFPAFFKNKKHLFSIHCTDEYAATTRRQKAFHKDGIRQFFLQKQHLEIEIWVTAFIPSDSFFRSPLVFSQQKKEHQSKHYAKVVCGTVGEFEYSAYNFHSQPYQYSKTKELLNRRSWQSCRAKKKKSIKGQQFITKVILLSSLLLMGCILITKC